ncbi:MAG: YtxH domain-containing protein [Synechococcaceae cyanobacterium RL_1_2]|nr:YtxH domain-containing protein [Synechococcaceae cyanobacterium RL_1_2]
MAKESNQGSFLGGLILGSAIGTVVGLIIAPRTGKETRKIIKKSTEALPELTEELIASLKLHSKDLSEQSAHRWLATLDRVQAAIAEGVKASQEEVIKIQTEEAQASSPNLD